MKATVSYRHKLKFLSVLSTFTVRTLVKVDIRHLYIILFSTASFVKSGAEAILLLRLSDYREKMRHFESKKHLGKVRVLCPRHAIGLVVCYLVMTTVALVFMYTVCHIPLKYL